MIQRRGLPKRVEHASALFPPSAKTQALRDADLFCFPTYYLAENQPGNLIEAMAFGLPIVTTRWRSMPEMLPPDYPGLVDSGIAGRNRRRAALPGRGATLPGRCAKFSPPLHA